MLFLRIEYWLNFELWRLQEIIHKYTSNSTPLAKHAAAASILNSLTWPTPQLTDYQTLAK
jgi:hypothetical protein